MKKIWLLIFITLVFAIPAFFLGKVIWSDNPTMPMPTSGQLPFFIFLSIVESLTFGLGVSFAIFGYSLVKKVSQKLKLKVTLSYISIIWLLVSWWPHDNLHRVNGMNMQGLLYIEYGFHLTLIIASLILAYTFISILKGIKIVPVRK